MIKMQTFNIVFLKTIKTLLMHLYHSTDDTSITNARDSGLSRLKQISVLAIFDWKILAKFLSRFGGRHRDYLQIK